MIIISDYIANTALRLSANRKRMIIAIDGVCASGKTTLAESISKKADCNIFRTDDFYLRPCQRTPKRYSEAGGNIDYERFTDEIVKNILSGADFSYRPFSCKTMDFSEEIPVRNKKINIIEGTYSLHPYFGNIYDLRIFLLTSRENQLERIKARNGEEALEMFKNKWIPLEEIYFGELNIMSKCDLYFET